ncbi:MAG: hypothetical protein RR311_07395 [Comamonas sp.]
MLDFLVGLQHFDRLAMQMNGVNIDAARCQSGTAPHCRIEGQNGLEKVQRFILKVRDGQLVRFPVQAQQQITVVSMHGGILSLGWHLAGAQSLSCASRLKEARAVSA